MKSKNSGLTTTSNTKARLITLLLVALFGATTLLSGNCTALDSQDSQDDLTLALILLFFVQSSQSTAVSMNSSEQEFHNLINSHRTSNAGCSALEAHSGLLSVARAHSQDMHDRNFFSHTNPDGLDPFDRLSNAGIRYTSAGENIAYGYSTAQTVLDTWLNSSGHKANIENCSYTHHGIGYVESGHYWTNVFAQNPR